MGRPDGFEKYDKETVVIAAMMDTQISESLDLTQDSVMEDVVEKINGNVCHRALLAPLCSSLSDARGGRADDPSGGPGPLRGPRPPKIYGQKDLPPANKEK
eukprot:15641589-Heterocapsa_arctica.AAC.1